MKNFRAGQVVVESVLVLPVLVMLFLCVLQTALYLYTYYIVNYASFCGARSAIVNCKEGRDPGRPARLSAIYVLSALGKNEKLIISGAITDCKKMGNEYQVKVTYPCRSIVPLLGGLLSHLPVSAVTRLKIS